MTEDFISSPWRQPAATATATATPAVAIGAAAAEQVSPRGHTAAAAGSAPAASEQVSPRGHTALDAAPDVVPVVADTLYALGQDAGFSGQEVNTDRRSITAYWKGKAPAGVRSYIASRPLGVTVTLVEGARHTRAENMAAAQRLVRAPIAAGLGIQSVAVNSDGSGVTARVDRGPAPSATARSKAAAVAFTDVTFKTTSPLVPTGTRANDAPGWKGGARTVQNGSACSTGFAVLRGRGGRLVTAHHCDNTANARVRDGASQTIAPGGSSVTGKLNIDSQIIDPSTSPETAARVYTGAWNSGTTKVVKSWANNWKGQPVCTSGATSGQHCGTIINDATTVPWASGSFYVEAQGSSHHVVVAAGDSGGPVFAGVTGGVQARGIILGGSDITLCGATNPDVLPLCYNNIIYAPIGVVLDSWGVRLLVG